MASILSCIASETVFWMVISRSSNIAFRMSSRSPNVAASPWELRGLSSDMGRSLNVHALRLSISSRFSVRILAYISTIRLAFSRTNSPSLESSAIWSYDLPMNTISAFVAISDVASIIKKISRSLRRVVIRNKQFARERGEQ